ncbi:MAG: molybdopterin molybdotransferase MoeA [Cyclobacteriaceae bacterium]|nr:molybdopterin molybdotransferase MoeA [Cyclobacteriaceae bacterium]
MISSSEALDIVLSQTFRAEKEIINIRQAQGRILMEDIEADRDFPPFDRVMMDGIAIRYEDYIKGQRSFLSEGIQAAGSPQVPLRNQGTCLEVMTGAIIPDGADTVVPYEWFHRDNEVFIIHKEDVKKGQNVHLKGTDTTQSTMVIPAGTMIEAPEIAVFASVGKNQIWVNKLPEVAVISTGDELVDVEHKPEKHQIRKSNVFAIDAELSKFGITASLMHLPDDPDIIENELRSAIIQFDAIILSGGISKGKYDHIPGALQQLNVQKLFQGVKQRPGKPFWFGMVPDGTVVFALPGNPVSTYLCFHKYIRPWLLTAISDPGRQLMAILDEDFNFAQELTYFLQVQVRSSSDGKWLATPIPGKGSGDHINLLKTDGFLELPAEKSNFKKGEAYPFIPFRNLLY